LWCNITLGLLKILLVSTYTTSGRAQTAAADQRLIKQFPKDLRQVRRIFGMEAQTIVSATCPKCFATYPPEEKGGVLVYPSRCSYQAPSENKSCRTQLTTNHVQDGESVRMPIQPFIMQDFDAFVASLLCREGMEQMLDNGITCERHDPLFDIKHSNLLRSIPDVDGKPFMRRTNGELRLAWSLCVDWFNPNQNMAAGKFTSVGLILMACLNLPPHLRYLPENLFPVAIIPTREPNGDQMNHILSPIVTKLLHSWQKGTWFTKTPMYPSGRLSRSVISISICDLPASKKINGFASHSADSFCSHCFTTQSDINNINSAEWRRRSREHHIYWATKWRDATTNAERKAIFRDHGVRWSELLRLPYWDPTRQVVVDGMHGLFLGIVQHHCREILGIDTSRRKTKQKKQISAKNLDEARSIVLSKSSTSQLRKIKIDVLRILCHRMGIPTVTNGRNVKKAQLVSELMARSTGNPSNPGHNEIDDDAAMPFGTGDDFTSVFSDGFADAHLSKDDIRLLQSHIQSTTRPSWYAPPPPNLGEPSHGKLKADEWRSCIEFDIPVALVQMAAKRKWRGGRIPQDKIIHSTMLLAMAVRWATSHTTSEEHVRKYNEYMHAYLQSLLDMFPYMKLRPNHHISLHLGPSFLDLGPMRGWWTFPFERMVGIFQKINTNSKLGE
jgi:hypothetical protein